MILFTRSNKIGSKLIRKITKEEVSHCALLYSGLVLHATFDKGVHLVRYDDFIKENEIVYYYKQRTTGSDFLYKIYRHVGKHYDYIAFVLLGLRFILKPIFPKISIWNISNMYICTELFRSDELLTPGQLYKQLLDRSKL